MRCWNSRSEPPKLILKTRGKLELLLITLNSTFQPLFLFHERACRARSALRASLTIVALFLGIVKPKNKRLKTIKEQTTTMYRNELRDLTADDSFGDKSSSYKNFDPGVLEIVMDPKTFQTLESRHRKPHDDVYTVMRLQPDGSYRTQSYVPYRKPDGSWELRSL